MTPIEKALVEVGAAIGEVAAIEVRLRAAAGEVKLPHGFNAAIQGVSLARQRLEELRTQLLPAPCTCSTILPWDSNYCPRHG